MNSLWLIIGAMAAFAVAYRYYSAFLAAKVAMLGIANKLLATIALAIGATYLLLRAPKRVYALCTGMRGH